jgi:amidase
MGGQIAIGGVTGPMARSLRDVKLVCQVLCGEEPWFFDPMVIEKPWAVVSPPKKAIIGVMWWDEVVMPHPPIQRALKVAVEKLRAAGHEGKKSEIKFAGTDSLNQYSH